MKVVFKISVDFQTFHIRSQYRIIGFLQIFVTLFILFSMEGRLPRGGS